MNQATLVPVEQYLRTNYEPDMDFVEGMLEERQAGEIDHATVQTEIPIAIRLKYGRDKFKVLAEVRVRISATRYRVPDICVLKGKLTSSSKVVEIPPYACVEVLSPEDRQSRVRKRIDDFLALGVPNVWLIDPEARRAWTCSKDGMTEVRDGILRATDGELELDLSQVYESLDEMRAR